MWLSGPRGGVLPKSGVGDSAGYRAKRAWAQPRAPKDRESGLVHSVALTPVASLLLLVIGIVASAWLVPSLAKPSHVVPQAGAHRLHLMGFEGALVECGLMFHLLCMCSDPAALGTLLVTMRLCRQHGSGCRV